MSAYDLAKALHVPVNRVTAILAGGRAVSADAALRLARFFSTTAEFWINLQGGHDLELARSKQGAAIAAEVPEAGACSMTAWGNAARPGSARPVRRSAALFFHQVPLWPPLVAVLESFET